MRLVRALPCAALLLAGCASARPTIDETAPRPAVILSGPDTPVIYAEQARSVRRTIANTPVSVWNAVQQTYAEYDIPLTVDNPLAKQLGNPEFHRTRKFVDRPLTELVDCGGSVTGPNAASYRIYMSLLTSVTDDGKGGTLLSTLFSAYARDMVSGTSNARIPCGSTGRFESKFLDRVTALAK